MHLQCFQLMPIQMCAWTLCGSEILHTNLKCFCDSLFARTITSRCAFKLYCRALMSGFVQKGQVFDCTATFIPDASTTLQSLQAICDVQGKAICSLLLVGSSTVPKVSFSFTTHDFGILFTPDTMDAHYDAMLPAPRISSRAVLKITNTDAHHECSISSSFSPTPIFDFKPVQFRLSPEEIIEVPITFSPREAKLYQAKIPFFVNDQPAAIIQVFGRGTSIRCESPFMIVLL